MPHDRLALSLILPERRRTAAAAPASLQHRPIDAWDEDEVTQESNSGSLVDVPDGVCVEVEDDPDTGPMSLEALARLQAATRSDDAC
jgi:hypothetical protein